MRLRTPVTLLVLLAVLAGAAYYGWHALTSPVTDTAVTTPPSVPKKRCPPAPRTSKHVVTSRDVTVSVFNAGTIAGLADQTMAALRRRGFHRGQIGNAPSGVNIVAVRIRAAKPKSAAARLVAAQFGVPVKRVLGGAGLGRGVDVILGDGFAGLVTNARTQLTVKQPSQPPKKACRNAAGKH